MSWESAGTQLRSATLLRIGLAPRRPCNCIQVCGSATWRSNTLLASVTVSSGKSWTVNATIRWLEEYSKVSSGARTNYHCVTMKWVGRSDDLIVFVFFWVVSQSLHFLVILMSIFHDMTVHDALGLPVMDTGRMEPLYGPKLECTISLFLDCVLVNYRWHSELSYTFISSSRDSKNITVILWRNVSPTCWRWVMLVASLSMFDKHPNVWTDRTHCFLLLFQVLVSWTLSVIQSCNRNITLTATRCKRARGHPWTLLGIF